MRTLLIAFALALAACDDGPTDGAAGPPTELAIVSGDRQTGLVGTELPGELIGRVVDAAGRPVGGVMVSWVGDGQPFVPASVSTRDGTTRNWWTLGPTAGEQRLEARWVNPDTGEPVVLARFTATARAGAASVLP